MPELPEVETIRRQLDHDLSGCIIVKVKTDWEKSFRPSFKVVSRSIVGKKISSIGRQAKLIIFKFRPPKDEPRQVYLIFHLKLTGRLLVRSPEDSPDDYTRSVFTLRIPDLNPSDPGSTRELRFADARKFGFVKLVTSQKEMTDLLKGYGPEPFKDLTFKNFTQILKSSARPVKIVLLDQAKISGIGNIYANDALWLSKVHPKTPAKKLNPKQMMSLYKSILIVLKRGLKYGGASDQWYVQAHGEKGEYQEHFLVYGKNGEKCGRCRREIQRLVVGGRGTFICPACQKEK